MATADTREHVEYLCRNAYNACQDRSRGIWVSKLLAQSKAVPRPLTAVDTTPATSPQTVPASAPQPPPEAKPEAKAVLQPGKEPAESAPPSPAPSPPGKDGDSDNDRRRGRAAAPADVCNLNGCSLRRLLDASGRLHDYCCIEHARADRAHPEAAR